MNIYLILSVLLGVVAAGLGVVCFSLWSRLQQQAQEAASARERLMRAELEAQSLRERMGQSQTDRELMVSQFQALSAQTLEQTADALLKRAEANFANRERLSMERMDLTLKPVTETLGRFEAKVNAIEKVRAEETGGLKEQIANLISVTHATRETAGKLASALRRGAGVQGRWGEETLRNVLTTAGLTQFDFTEQTSTDSEEGRRRPDVTVRLPGGGVFVIDSKVNLTAFLEAMEQTDDLARDAALTRHAQALKTHVRDLSAKAYWDTMKDATPDFVALFIPGDGFLAAALDKLPELMSEAMDKRVIIVTPTTLFALCKAVAYGWRVEDQAANAREVADLGRELYKRLSVMGGHVAQMGRALDGAVGKYNAFVGSLETQVLSQARRFEDLKVEHEGKSLPELTAIEAAPRSLSKLEA